MANTKSAKKAVRSSEKKRVFNLAKENKIKESVKTFKKSLVSGAKDVEKNLAKAYSSLDKAVKTKFLSKQTASRRKSRLVAMMRKAVSK
jgi:small subunit ribosomal protein S20